jgi:putative copper export protein
VALAATVWAVAAVARYRLIPAVVRSGSSAPLIRNARIEAALLLGVLTLTGALTTQAPP